MVKSKSLPGTRNESRHKTMFYKSGQIRFQQLWKPQLRIKHPVRKIVCENNPWQTISNSDIRVLIDRLEDEPKLLFEVIKRRRQQCERKFKLLRNSVNKYNKVNLSQEINAKQKKYKDEFRQLLCANKRSQFVCNLPKLGQVRSVLGDHHMTISNKTQQRKHPHPLIF